MGDWVDGIKFDEFEIVQWDGINEPAVAPANCARVYYNRTTNKFMVSRNGGAYAEFILSPTHTDLSDMPDVGGANTDHDARYIREAPIDSTMYGRKDGAWERITLIPPVVDWWDPTGGLPVDPEDGDRYASDGTAEGWTEGYIYEWDDLAGEWVEVEPEEGYMFWMLAELLFYVFFSGGWMEMGEFSYLKLDQTTPQHVINGAPQFDEGVVIKSGKKVVYDGT